MPEDVRGIGVVGRGALSRASGTSRGGGIALGMWVVREGEVGRVAECLLRWLSKVRGARNAAGEWRLMVRLRMSWDEFGVVAV